MSYHRRPSAWNWPLVAELAMWAGVAFGAMYLLGHVGLAMWRQIEAGIR